MDPNATLRRIFDAIADQDHEETFYACLDLQGWLNKGGFAPEGHTKQDLLAFLRVTKQVSKLRSIE